MRLPRYRWLGRRRHEPWVARRHARGESWRGPHCGAEGRLRGELAHDAHGGHWEGGRRRKRVLERGLHAHLRVHRPGVHVHGHVRRRHVHGHGRGGHPAVGCGAGAIPGRGAGDARRAEASAGLGGHARRDSEDALGRGVGARGLGGRGRGHAIGRCSASWQRPPPRAHALDAAEGGARLRAQAARHERGSGVASSGRSEAATLGPDNAIRRRHFLPRSRRRFATLAQQSP
mmetsp:Transcript_19057/g.36708  ORF Transcript_19057/g.36708 Transcript_19057/m.36708 type:complete len:231 (-) Transcript_19057:1014-1706(-)